MLLLVSGATATKKRHRKVGELIVPTAWSSPEALQLLPGRWAMDNGAFSGFDAAAFMRMLEAFYGFGGCRFVACPDVVADGFATLELWPFWSRVIRGVGLPPALVLQDGMNSDDIPWKQLAAVFVGGSTEWKLGPQAQTLIAYAQSRGLWVHMGRVNTERRIWDAARMGCDSFDGSGFSRWPDIRIPKGLQWADEAQQAQQVRLV
jgi:hypothetical protein